MTLWSRCRRFLAFNGVGAIGIAVQLAVIAVLAEGIGLDYRAATVAAVAAALGHNFTWHWVWTWADRRTTGAPMLPALGRFLLANGAVSLVGNVVLMRVLVGSVGLPVLPASGLAIAACGLVNYWLADRHVFVPQASGPTPQCRNLSSPRLL